MFSEEMTTSQANLVNQKSMESVLGELDPEDLEMLTEWELETIVRGVNFEGDVGCIMAGLSQSDEPYSE